MIELEVSSPAGGGASVGRDSDGRAVFVEGALPGERVRVELHTEKKRFARGRAVEILDVSPDRIEPICRTSREGCGGCDLSHTTLDTQRAMKEQVVADSLTRIARLPDVPDLSTRPTIEHSYRTTVRAAVVDGSAGYRRRWSHNVVTADECRVAHPLLEELLACGDFGDASEVTIRVSELTEERLVVVDGTVETVKLSSDVAVVCAEDAANVSITENAGGRDWRVSGGSFFQSGPAAASALVESARTAAGSSEGLRVVDAYGGVGLFAGTVGADASHVTLVEAAASSCADARVNLDELGRRATVVESAVERWTPSPADLVIADPGRSGLGQSSVDVLCATGNEQFVLVSCDTGSLGRDVGLLVGAGFEVASVEIVDAFPDTSHVETVVGLRRQTG